MTWPQRASFFSTFTSHFRCLSLKVHSPHVPLQGCVQGSVVVQGTSQRFTVGGILHGIRRLCLHGSVFSTCETNTKFKLSLNMTCIDSGCQPLQESNLIKSGVLLHHTPLITRDGLRMKNTKNRKYYLCHISFMGKFSFFPVFQTTVFFTPPGQMRYFLRRRQRRSPYHSSIPEIFTEILHRF
jgi:hypothetical protein